MIRDRVRRTASVAVLSAIAALTVIIFAGAATPQPLAPKPHYLGVEPDRSASTSSSVPGVRVSAIARGSPAEQAGVQVGDVIVKLGTVTIMNPEDLDVALRSTAPGRPAELVYLRRAQTQVILEGRR